MDHWINESIFHFTHHHEIMSSYCGTLAPLFDAFQSGTNLADGHTHVRGQRFFDSRFAKLPRPQVNASVNPSVKANKISPASIWMFPARSCTAPKTPTIKPPVSGAGSDCCRWCAQRRAGCGVRSQLSSQRIKLRVRTRHVQPPVASHGAGSGSSHRRQRAFACASIRYAPPDCAALPASWTSAKRRHPAGDVSDGNAETCVEYDGRNNRHPRHRLARRNRRVDRRSGGWASNKRRCTSQAIASSRRNRSSRPSVRKASSRHQRQLRRTDINTSRSESW